MSPREKDLSIDNRYLNTRELLSESIRLQSHPWHAQIELTTKCNLDCIMCSREKYHGAGKHLSRDLLSKIQKEIFPWLQEAIISSFGEPLLHPDIGEIIEAARRHPRLNIGFYTNLLPLTEEKAEQVVRNGVSYLCVSIDGATKETYEKIRKNGHWERLTANLEMLNAFKKKYKSRKPFMHLVIVDMTANIGELPLFVDFAKKFGFGAVKIAHNIYVDDDSMEYLSLVHQKAYANRMYALAHAKAMQAGIPSNFNVAPFILSEEEKKSLEDLPMEKNKGISSFAYQIYFNKILPQMMRIKNTWDFSGKSAGHFFNLFLLKFYRKYFDPARHGRVGLSLFPNDAPPRHCGNPWTHVRIDVDGKVYPCCYNHTEMGDLNSQTFEEIWNGERYASLRQSIVKKTFWATCRRASCNWIQPGSSEVYGAEYVSLPAEIRLIAYEESEIKVRVRNTSQYWWSGEKDKEEDIFYLSYRLFDAHKRLVMEGSRGEMPAMVAPLQTAEIRLKLWAIAEPGDYEMRLDMVHDGVTWFGERGNHARSVPVKVLSFYKSRLTPVEPIPAQIEAGGRIVFDVRIENISDSRWQAGGADGVRLSYHWKHPGGDYAEFEGVRTFLPHDIPAGGSALATMTIIAPPKPNDYILELELVREGRAWFFQKGQPPHTIPIKVV